VSIKAVKFGGSSLADASHFKKAAEIIKSDPERKFVIPSAPGGRSPDDVKVTDMLLKTYEIASKGGDITDIFGQIKLRYDQIIEGLGLDMSLEAEFAKIKNGVVNKAGRDYTASRGEYLNGLVMARYIGFPFIDAAEVIFFNNNGSFDAELTNSVMGKKLSKYENAVIPGFYGIMPNGTIKTFPRGGSDITGAIVARAAGASMYENWTNVSGVLMADPRIIKDPKPIDIMTYRELRELSYMGFSFFFEDSIFPVKLA
jgi:aspartate kinase